MLCLIGALIFVILDINQSLAALKLEMVVDMSSICRNEDNFSIDGLLLKEV